MTERKLRVLRFLPGILLLTAMLACSAVANLPNPFATSTPTATATSTPTSTPSPTPTRPTSTPTITPVPSGVILQEQAGGWTLMTDYDAGYSIDIPAGWLALKADAADLRIAASALEDSNPALADSLKSLIDLKPDSFRVIAYDIQPEHMSGADFASFNIVMAKDARASSLPLGMVVKSGIEALKQQMPGTTARQMPPKSNAHGVAVASAELQIKLKGNAASQAPWYGKQLYFQTDNAFVAITLMAPKDKATAVLASFDKIIDGIQRFKP